LASPATPTVTTAAATCLANGTATVTNYLSTNTYSSTPAGLTVGAAGVITGFTCGTSYTITATNAATCQATSTSFTVDCQLASLATPTVTTAAATCLANGTATVSNYLSTNTYSSTPVGLTVGSGGVVTGFTCGTSYTITATNAASCQATSASFIVGCKLSVPIVNVGSPVTIIEGEQTVLNGAILGNSIVSSIWTPGGVLNSLTFTVSPLVTTTFRLTATNINGCSSFNTVLVKVLPLLKIPNVFSPNGDNINDKWVIPGIDKYPESSLSIYNRYGQLVKKTIGYKNDWDGTLNGKALPVGTYFYVLEYVQKTKKTIGGSVSILR
jgi:gliding motility-associated-like protein